ncbi:MAG: flippase [Deltaproteobacteria bacterium]|nr:flippase [Deltaproteobacteria bacterium]
MNEGNETGRRIRSRDVMMNAVTSYGGNVIDIAVFLVLLPFIINTVGTQDYGLWSLVWAIVSVLAMMDLGFSQSVVKFVADARGRDDDDRQRTVVCTLFWVFVAQMAAIMVLVGLAALFFEDIFNVPADKVDTARQVLLIVGGGFAVGVPFGMFRGVLTGHQKQWAPNIYKILATITYSALVLVLLRVWPGLRTLAFLNLTITIGPLLATAIHARRAIPFLSLSPRYFDRSVLGEIWSHSFYFMLINVSGLIYTRVDTFIIQAALDLTAVAVYSLAMRVSDQVQNLTLHVARILTPVVAQLHGANDEERLLKVWLKGTKIAVALAAPLVVGCMALARPLVVNWTNNDFLGSAPVLQILLAAVFVNVVHSNSHILLSMRGRQRFLAFVLLAAQAVNAGLSILLVGRWGILGVAAATLAANLPFQVLLVQLRLKKLYDLSLAAFYGRTVLPSLLPLAVMLAVFWGWERVHAVSSLVEVGVVEAVGVLIFWAVFWKTGLDGDEREQIAAQFRGLMHRDRK